MDLRMHYLIDFDGFFLCYSFYNWREVFSVTPRLLQEGFQCDTPYIIGKFLEGHIVYWRNVLVLHPVYYRKLFRGTHCILEEGFSVTPCILQEGFQCDTLQNGGRFFLGYTQYIVEMFKCFTLYIGERFLLLHPVYWRKVFNGTPCILEGGFKCDTLYIGRSF